MEKPAAAPTLHSRPICVCHRKAVCNPELLCTGQVNAKSSMLFVKPAKIPPIISSRQNREQTVPFTISSKEQNNRTVVTMPTTPSRTSSSSRYHHASSSSSTDQIARHRPSTPRATPFPGVRCCRLSTDAKMLADKMYKRCKNPALTQQIYTGKIFLHQKDQRATARAAQKDQNKKIRKRASHR